MNPHVSNLAWNFGLFDWIPAAGPESIASSELDVSLRPIGVTVFLEDPRARTPHVWAQAPNKTENHVNVDDSIVDIWVESNADGFVSSLLFGTHATSPAEGTERCCSILFSLLSSWSFQAQRPMAVREWLVEDRAHRAKWVVRPQAQEQEPLKLNGINVSLAPANPIGSLVALFREGMASVQPAYRFWCYYKILEAWKEGLGPFKQVNQLFSDQGKKPVRRSLTVQADMFKRKCKAEKYEHLIGKKFGWCFERMINARNFIAHPFIEDGAFVSLDSPDTLGYLSDAANLAESMAIEIIVEEMRVIRALTNSETTERVMASYVHESWGKDLL